MNAIQREIPKIFCGFGTALLVCKYSKYIPILKSSEKLQNLALRINPVAPAVLLSSGFSCAYSSNNSAEEIAILNGRLQGSQAEVDQAKEALRIAEEGKAASDREIAILNGRLQGSQAGVNQTKEELRIAAEGNLKIIKNQYSINPNIRFELSTGNNFQTGPNIIAEPIVLAKDQEGSLSILLRYRADTNQWQLPGAVGHSYEKDTFESALRGLKQDEYNDQLRTAIMQGKSITIHKGAYGKKTDTLLAWEELDVKAVVLEGIDCNKKLIKEKDSPELAWKFVNSPEVKKLFGGEDKNKYIYMAAGLKDFSCQISPNMLLQK